MVDIKDSFMPGNWDEWVIVPAGWKYPRRVLEIGLVRVGLMPMEKGDAWTIKRDRGIGREMYFN